MTSSNGNIFRVTGRLCGEFTGHRWIPSTKASDAELLFSLICAWINGWVNNGEAGDLRRHRSHYDVSVTVYKWYLEAGGDPDKWLMIHFALQKWVITHRTNGLSFIQSALFSIRRSGDQVSFDQSLSINGNWQPYKNARTFVVLCFVVVIQYSLIPGPLCLCFAIARIIRI